MYVLKVVKYFYYLLDYKRSSFILMIKSTDFELIFVKRHLENFKIFDYSISIKSCSFTADSCF